MRDFLVAATPPIVAALLAAAGVWLRRRGQVHKDERAVAEAQSRIATITSMLDAFSHDPARLHELREELEAAYRQMSAAQDAARTQASGAGMRSMVRELLLLDRPPRTATGIAVQLLYYASLAWVLLWLAAAVMFGLGIAFMDSGDSFGTRIAMSFGITILALAIGLAPSFVLYLIARMSGGTGAHPRGPDGTSQ